MKRKVLALALLAPIAVGFGAYKVFAKDAKASKNTPHEEHAPVVSVQELKQLVDTKGATIIDANGSKMYNDGHVPGAISFAAHENDLAKVLPADKNALLVAYCGGTMCSAWEGAAKEARKLGYTNIKHFKEGIAGWKKAGMPTESAKPST